MHAYIMHATFQLLAFNARASHSVLTYWNDRQAVTAVVAVVRWSKMAVDHKGKECNCGAHGARATNAPRVGSDFESSPGAATPRTVWEAGW